jgi:hypothetical protein
MPVQVSDVTHPSSGGFAQMLIGVLTCVGLRVDYVQVARSQHTSYARNYTNSICADPPENGRVTPKTCRGIDS